METETKTETSDASASVDAKRPHGFFGKLWHEWVKPLGLVILVVTALRSSLVDWNDVPSGSMRPTILEGDRIVVNKLAYGLNVPFNGPKIDLPFLPVFNNPLDFGPRFLWSKPKRGEIVTFWNPTPDRIKGKANPSSGIRMVKRIVGVPGDTLRVVDGRLEITDKDGQRVEIGYAEDVDGPYKAEPAGAYNVALKRGSNQQELPVTFLLENLGGVEHFIQFIEAYGGWTPSGHRYRNVPAEEGEAITLLDSDDLGACEYFMVGDNRDNSADSRYYEVDLGIKVRGEHITGKAKFIAVSFDGSWLRPVGSRWFRSFDGEARESATR